MERRLIRFVIASTAFFMVYIWVRTLLVPPQPQILSENGSEIVVDGDTNSQELIQSDPNESGSPESNGSDDDADATSDSVDDEPESSQDDQATKPERPENPSW
ncbi:MAG: hypothetical protein ACPHL6_09590, partial [Rubripirellula sp.]